MTVGFAKGAQQEVLVQSDYMALVIAFLIVLAIFAGIGFFVDSAIYKFRKKKFEDYSTSADFEKDIETKQQEGNSQNQNKRDEEDPDLAIEDDVLKGLEAKQ